MINRSTFLQGSLCFLLSLNLECEIKVRLVKLVHTDISVLSARRVSLSGWVDCDGVERSEVATHTADLLLKDLVVETRLELSLACRGGGDVHGGLSSSEDDKVLLWCDGCRVEWGIGDVGLHDLEVGGIDNLGGAVLGGSDAVGAIWGPLDICDLLSLLVNHDVVKLLSGLQILSA